MDDYPTLIGNAAIGEASSLQLSLKAAEGQVYFRPLTHLLNLITYTFFGQQPPGYHLFNLLLFYLAGLTFYALFSRVVKDKTVVFLATVLFFVHPINGVLVNYKNATGFSLLLLAMNLSLLRHLSIFEGRERTSGWILGFTWLGVALLCHEVAVMFPLYLALVLFFIGGRPKKILLHCLPSFIMAVGYLLFRMLWTNLKGHLIDKAALFDLSLFEYIAAFAKLVFWYISQLFFPENVVLMWNTGFQGGGVWGWSLFLVGLVVVCLGLVVRGKKNPVSFGLMWLAIGFIPVVLGCFSRPWFGIIIEPHWLSYSSMGFFLIAGVGLVWLQKFLRRSLWIMVVSAVLVFCVVVSQKYNFLWGNQIRYCTYWLTSCPGNFMPLFWLAYGYLEREDYWMARHLFLRMLERGVRYEWVYGNLGLCEYHLHNYEAALKYFDQARQLNPGKADTLYYTGLIYLEHGDLQKSEEAFKQAIVLDAALIDSGKKLKLIEQLKKSAEAR